MRLFQRRLCLIYLLLSLPACGRQQQNVESQQSPELGTRGPAAALTASATMAAELATAAPRPTELAQMTSPLPSAAATSTAPGQSVRLGLKQVVDGLEHPTFATHAGDGTGRLFVVEKVGRIRIVVNGALQARPFLDIADRVGSSGNEQGLFSVAFHPHFRSNGQLFVDYTDRSGNTVVARLHVSSDLNVVDVSSAVTLLTVDQPEANHNGGQLAFGPDGYLYIGLGDGGGAGDRHGEHGNGQNGAVLLGKILRIDVDGKAPYAIPPDNPFVGKAGMRPEIWALGVRNPWRFSFDRATGDLYIADVGQDKWEEVDVQPTRSGGGQNYGWNTMEAAHCFDPAEGCTTSGLQAPVAEYSHDLGCSITGGYRYRGKSMPAFEAGYFFADYCSGRVWVLTAATGGAWTKKEVLQTSYGISSFGEDEVGELYLMDYDAGVLYRLQTTNS